MLSQLSAVRPSLHSLTLTVCALAAAASSSSSSPPTDNSSRQTLSTQVNKHRKRDRHQSVDSVIFRIASHGCIGLGAALSIRFPFKNLSFSLFRLINFSSLLLSSTPSTSSLPLSLLSFVQDPSFHLSSFHPWDQPTLVCQKIPEKSRAHTARKTC